MNSQDITRALIDTALERGLQDMDADPRRSVRKLCDLGKHFATGRFQNELFAMFQDLLRNDNSPYYKVIEMQLRHTSHLALRRFGINVGYNSFTYGAGVLRETEQKKGCNIPWTIQFRLDDTVIPTDFKKLHRICRDGSATGIYTYLFRSLTFPADWEAMIHLFSAHPNCAFVWFLPDMELSKTQLLSLVSCPNVMTVFPYGVPSTAKNADAMRAKRALFGTYCIYTEEDVQNWTSGFGFPKVGLYQIPVVCLIAHDSCTDETKKKVAANVHQARFAPQYPLFPIELYGDIQRIDRIISDETCFLDIYPDRSIHTPTGIIRNPDSYTPEELLHAVLPRLGYSRRE